MITRANLAVLEKLVYGEQFPNSPRVMESFAKLVREIEAMEQEL